MKNQVKLFSVASTMCMFVLSTGAFAGSANYSWDFQRRVGGFATFHVAGPATGTSHRDVQGDAMLQTVTMPNGDEFIQFYKPIRVYDATYNGRLTKWLVRAGSNTTIGLNDENYTVRDALREIGQDRRYGDYDSIPSQHMERFEQKILSALETNNLNNYVDNGDSNSAFYFTIEFELPIKDNDAGPDDFGEILYFERGSGNGNSWMKMQAVDENGSPLGPWLVIAPTETVQTSPVSEVYRRGQFMGTTAIDVSRLGVEEVKYLRVSNDVRGESAYTGGGDRNPDFKIMAVITHPEHLNMKIAFD